MKKYLNILLILLSMVTLSCNKTPVCDCFDATGNPTEETRVVPYFEQVHVEDDVNLVISIGSSEQVIIQGGSNLVHNISANVSNNVLTLKNNNICNWLRSYRKSIITVYITMPRVTYLENEGSGNITSSDTIAMDTLQVQTISSGDINLMVHTNTILGHMFGPGDVTLNGISTNLLCTANGGTGFLYASSLKTSYTFISTTTTGDCYVNASSLLIALINLRGNVYYSGTPTIESTIKGAGQLIKE
ncbi:MAG TPA: DUF2807 domain-containing protein [Bacteroidia bacterium]|jgi:hypothetical protein|nr:DUF2807 domain-containing protein [Bacteroidia bacterium]